MRPTVDVWLEIVKERLDQGEGAVVAVAKANIVTNAYVQRFCVKEGIGLGMLSATSQESQMSIAAARAWFEKLAEEEKQREKANFPIPTSGYVAGDENAR